ncbi:phage baseplate assembly protein V [Helicovermis profundi]|uniref:Phage baseplate assembly protein V n=1 Tax=Helicovermis profundi TaxID=3065157 RepID=A0AAU9E8J3_9FIRM|nr:phage baseplate assembly protein V [Clostridia bacterium S502]
MNFEGLDLNYKIENKNRFYGVTIGEVTNNQDPTKLGRVKIKIHDKFGDLETDWARITSSYTGKDRGLLILPEVGDEVLVVFRDGDMREPYVIGSLWNQKELPPEKNENGKNNIKILKTRKGHTITIDDDDKAGFIEIKTENGTSVLLDNKDKGKIKIFDKGKKATAEFDGNSGDVKISGNNKLTIDSKSSKIIVDGTKNEITITSSAKIGVKAAQIELKASGTLDIKSGGIVNIKGTLVKIN